MGLARRVLRGRTIAMLRTLTALAVLSFALPSCTPRVGVAGGAITTVVGGAILIHGTTKADNLSEGIVHVGEMTTGGTLALTGLAIMLGSAIWLAFDHDDEPRAAPPAALAPLAIEPQLARPGSATAVLNGRVAQLTAELQLEARAGHCAAANAIAGRLATLELAHVIALAERDPAVASCIATR